MMSGRGSMSAFSSFQINSQDVWDADDGEYLRIISYKAARKTAQKVLESHKKETSGISSVALPAVTECNSTALRADTTTTSGPSPLSKHAPGMGVRLRATPDDRPPVQQLLLDHGRMQRFRSCISAPIIDLSALRHLAWSGVPGDLRPLVWKLLCDYLPASEERRKSVLAEKRRQYSSFVEQYFHLREQPSCKFMFHQIQKDLTRMTLLYRRPDLLAMFERILFIWSMRHPGSGYVQGINDLLTPFFVVFLAEYTRVDLNTSGELSLQYAPESVHLDAVEADVFWCTSHLLDTIQDNYTFAQPGIQNNVSMLASLIERVDVNLHRHLVAHNVEFLQFAFRWMNNLLIRELPLRCIIRLWDTYMAERSGFSAFHVYVCAAFLLQFSPELQRQQEFQGLMLLLQHLPTYHWTDEDINLVLAEAFRLQSLFASAPHHLDYRRQTTLD
ncbi:TBC1 domain family member 2 [Paragonimus westermani]|uniref:TBC1 domain family member 2 n=2 Tax=Paragonimus TaxID=34503 RepID=A0A5J4NZZ9_9TREM|nr:TBC1 domain family member 2 [Paragonimus westermani]